MHSEIEENKAIEKQNSGVFFTCTCSYFFVLNYIWKIENIKFVNEISGKVVSCIYMNKN